MRDRNASTFCVCPETKIAIEHLEQFPWCNQASNHKAKCKKRTGVISAISAPSFEASPEWTHPEASLSHFTKKTDRCPYPESSLDRVRILRSCPIRIRGASGCKVCATLACLPALQPCPLAAECLFCPKLSFQSRHSTGQIVK